MLLTSLLCLDHHFQLVPKFLGNGFENVEFSSTFQPFATINNNDFTIDISREIRNQITDWVQIETNQYTIDSWGGISNLDISVNNDTDFTLNSTNRGISIKIKTIKINSNDLEICYNQEIVPAVGDPDPYKCK